jgi:hypothetical protein
MSKHNYRLYGAGYGGELVIGETNEHFVRYWASRVEDDHGEGLIEYLTDWDLEINDDPDQLEDPDSSPTPGTPDQEFEPGAWHDFDDIEHCNTTFADSWVRVVPLDENGEEDDENEFNIELGNTHYFYSREAYFRNEEPDWTEEKRGDYKPVLSFFSSEKGGFWSADLELDEPFNEKLFSMGVIESTLCELAEAFYYNGEEIDQEFECDTSGKGYYANVGWMNMRWHDSEDKYHGDAEFAKDLLDDWKEHKEYMEEEGEL